MIGSILVGILGSHMPGESRSPPDGRFATTNWSLVRQAADSRDPRRGTALESLCRYYWVSVYAYIRRRGQSIEQARDTTQAFFTFLLEKKLLSKADRERGRFRSFLLASVKNFLNNEWDRESAQKRGGGAAPLSFDFDAAEDARRTEPRAEETPETLFEREWAHALLRRTLERLQEEMSRTGQERRFEKLRPFLVGETDCTYVQAAAALEMTVAAIKVAVYRLRKRFGVLLREEVAHGLCEPADVEAEIRYLFDRLE